MLLYQIPANCLYTTIDVFVGIKVRKERKEEERKMEKQVN